MSSDNVNSPSHYRGVLSKEEAFVRDRLIFGPHAKTEGDILNLEAFEAMISCFSFEELRGYLRGNSFKYRWRYRNKAGLEDLKKAQWYEQMLLALEEALEEFKTHP
ncbi:MULTISPECIES: DUF3310 domain-containing protein [unclassified Thioalkalivibrio]|uniref:DUF3310 domain-containing protein n=1 Tax=unclassified Thioalkalivibrio TaxID=2621013 RepID=UPI000373DCD8|nr:MULTISPECIES: DUF3310 domain-containing protein [unclassified Thioalkalivibrio]